MNTQNDVFVGLINSYQAMGGGWVDSTRQEADRVDFPGEHSPSGSAGGQTR